MARTRRATSYRREGVPGENNQRDRSLCIFSYKGASAPHLLPWWG